MAQSYQQIDTSASADTKACAPVGAYQKYNMSAGAAAGTVSRSLAVGTSTLKVLVSFNTDPGDPGTLTYAGVCIMRFNVTTANTNITWSELRWCNECALSGVAATYTSGLAISLGTTGIKTASVEATAATGFQCLTLSAVCQLLLAGSNVSTMNAVFNWVNDQIVTLPFGGAPPPATSVTYTLAQTKAGI